MTILLKTEYQKEDMSFNKSSNNNYIYYIFVIKNKIKVYFINIIL